MTQPTGAIEPLTKSVRFKQVSILKRKSADAAQIKRARDLHKELFSKIGREDEDGLVADFRENLAKRQSELKQYSHLASTRHHPGKDVIEQTLSRIAKQLAIRDPFEFVEALLSKKDEWLPVSTFDMEKLGDSTPAYLFWADTGWQATKATQIVSYKYRHFTLPHIYTYREEHKEQLLGLGKNCKQMVKELDSMIEFLRERFSTGTHLMGTFDSIQYYPSECSSPLFCFEGDLEFYNFGDGNGQLFFEKDDKGKITFSFHWSCY